MWWFKCDFYFKIMAEGIILFISKRHYTINLVRFRNHVLRITPNARFLTTSLGTRFATLRSVSRSRDGPSSRVLSHVLGVWIHVESLQNEPLAQKWRNEVGRIFVWFSCLAKTLNFSSGRLVSHSDLPMHIAGYIVPYYFRR